MLWFFFRDSNPDSDMADAIARGVPKLSIIILKRTLVWCCLKLVCFYRDSNPVHRFHHFAAVVHWHKWVSS